MKNLIIVIIVFGLFSLLITTKENKKVAESIKEISNNGTSTISKTAADTIAEIQIKLIDRQEKSRKEAWNREKTKVYVRAKDTKTCMKELKTDVINNEVAECNRDHYIELRNDEIEIYKQEQKL